MGRDIIFCIELDNKSDIEFVKNYLSLFFKVNYPNIHQTFHQCYMKESYEDNIVNFDIDVLQRGLECISKIYSKCKVCETWIFYVGVGDIYNNGNVMKDITMILMDKNPKNRECIYSVHKNKMKIGKNYTKCEKINNIKILSDSLHYLLSLDESNCRIIKYKNYRIKKV